MIKSIDRFSPEEAARLMKNAEHDRQWLKENSPIPDRLQKPVSAPKTK